MKFVLMTECMECVKWEAVLLNPVTEETRRSAAVLIGRWPCHELLAKCLCAWEGSGTYVHAWIVCVYMWFCACARPWPMGRRLWLACWLSAFFLSLDQRAHHLTARPNMHALPNSLTRTGIYTCMHADPFLQTHMHRRTHIGVHTYTGTHRDRDNGMDWTKLIGIIPTKYASKKTANNN